jgi:hypothetical protein
MSNAPLNTLDGGMIGGATAANTAPVMPLDPDNQNPIRGPELAQAAGRINTYDQHMLAHKFRIDALEWKPTQLPGTILGNWKNHPNIHPFTRLVGAQYLYWAGSFKLTFTICGSGLVGGRLRFIRIPPHVSDEDIRRMTVNDLSYFDGVDMDPKSLLQISIPFEDINRLKMHKMTQDLSSEDSFGSRIIVMVYGQLQAQIGDNTGISVIVEVEMNPDFTLSTFIPKQIEAPLNDYSILNFGSSKKAATYCSRRVSNIKVLPGTTRVAVRGFNRLTAPGGETHWKDNDEQIWFAYGDPALWPKGKNEILADADTVVANGGNAIPGWWGLYMYTYPTEDASGMVPIQLNSNFELNPSDPTLKPMQAVFEILSDGYKNACYHCILYQQLVDEGSKFVPFNNERILEWVVKLADPTEAGLTHSINDYWALQCDELREKMSRVAPFPKNQALIFSVNDSESGSVLMYTKLYPNGAMTTVAGEAGLDLPSNVEFRFLSVGTVTDLIPVLTPAARADLAAVDKEMKRTLRRAARARAQ